MAHTIAAVNISKGKRPKLTDFLLSWTHKRRQTADEQLALLQGLAARQERLIRGNNR